MADAQPKETAPGPSDGTMKALIAKAHRVAETAHDGQVDLGGEDYIEHPRRIAKNFKGDEKITALLHDVVEDSRFTLDDLAREGFPRAVIDAVDAMTKRPEESQDYDAYIRRVKRNPIARRVKMADLKDNMNLDRIPNPTDKDRALMETYRKAFNMLKEPGDVE